MERNLLVINTGHFTVINSRAMSYTGINLISLYIKQAYLFVR